MSVKYDRIPLDNTYMEYIRFGRGKKYLVMLPGLGESLRSLKGTSHIMALLYRIFTREYTVFLFSRRKHIPDGFTTRDMAADQKRAMDHLGIPAADVFGVSMGGMIAQHLAADYPERVGKLVLTVTSCQPNPTLARAVTEWMDFAEQDDHAGLMASNLELIYSPAYRRRNKGFLPLVSALTKPPSYEFFLRQSRACLNHNSFDRLPQIRAATLVVGGEQDKVADPAQSHLIAKYIPGARLLMYPQWGHGLYDEEKNFNKTVLAFLTE